MYKIKNVQLAYKFWCLKSMFRQFLLKIIQVFKFTNVHPHNYELVIIKEFLFYIAFAIWNQNAGIFQEICIKIAAFGVNWIYTTR